MSATPEPRDRDSGPLVLTTNIKRFLTILVTVWSIAAVLLVILDYTVNFSRGSDVAEIRRLFNTTREDGLPSFVAVTQATLFALTLWLVWAVRRKRLRARWLPAGWLFLAVSFSYMALDDGSRLHERIGSTVAQNMEERQATTGEEGDTGGGLLGFPSYSWQVVYGPFFAVLGVFTVLYLARELGRRRWALLFLAMALNVIAVGMDFVEGLDDDHALNLYTKIVERWDGVDRWADAKFQEGGFDTLVHFSKSIEECLEMLATTILWALCLEYLMRIAPDLRFRFTGRPGAGSHLGRLTGRLSMPIPSPFHPRTAARCTSLLWKDWAGYYAVRSYDTVVEREYFALRHAAGLLDVTPLYKYAVQGKDAAAFLSWILVRDAGKLKTGQVAYTCWCDEEGKVVDDGTVSRFAPDRFRLTAAEPSLAWLTRHRQGFAVDIEDVSDRIAALSLQGPRSRAILEAASGADLAGLRFFRFTETRIGGVAVVVSRTGYTGDLGYEIWADAADALPVWDAVMAAGEPHGLLPMGLDALDVARIEAGFIMSGVDYYSAPHCLIPSRKSTPLELGLGWMVDLERERFLGQEALRAEKRAGPIRVLAGLALDWDEFAALFEEHRLPPQVPSRAWRDPVPVYDTGGRQIGQATSGAWSPLLKENLALATVTPAHGEPGQKVQMEVTVEYRRLRVTARVVPRPFFDPERKKS